MAVLTRRSAQKTMIHGSFQRIRGFMQLILRLLLPPKKDESSHRKGEDEEDGPFVPIGPRLPRLRGGTEVEPES